ncbi:putative mitochondrial protein, partial [Mucuna pruriens]
MYQVSYFLICLYKPFLYTTSDHERRDKTLEKNSTWEIVNKTKDKRGVGCRWIYTMKCKSDGTLDRHKVRLVAKGYTQTYGINCEEIFAL